MELKEIVKKYQIIGVVSNYQSTLDMSKKIVDLNIKNIDAALKMVGLTTDFKDKQLADLTLSELWRVELATKLHNEIIIIGNLFNSLNHKDLQYIHQLFHKLSSEYQKQIVIIDNHIEVFMGIVKRIVVIQDKKVVYETSDFYDAELYKYVRMPKIIEFIKYVNEDGEKLNQTIDIYELIKDIYRVVS